MEGVWTWGMWGNWAVREWVVGVSGAMWVATIVAASLCGTFLWALLILLLFFYFVLIVKKGQGLWASRNEWNNL